MAAEIADLGYIRDDAEMPRSCPHLIRANGSRIAASNALQAAIALRRVLLVRTLYEAIVLFARDSASIPRARGRGRRQPSTFTRSAASLKEDS
jgi:hypothetical protein